MAGFIPQPDYRLSQMVLLTQCAEARGAQQEILAGRHFKIEPASGEDAQEMPVRKNQHVAFDRAHPAHDAIGASADLFRRFSSGAAVAELLPVRALRTNLGRTAALVLAVVPFDKVRVDFGGGPKAGQFASLERAP